MTSLRLAGVGHLLALMPYEFGFVPTGSLVVTLMRADRVVASIRFDEHLLEGGRARHIRDHVLASTDRLDVTGVVVTAYGCSPELDIDVAVEALKPCVEIEHALVVAQDVWWATTCARACCDGALTPLLSAVDVPQFSCLVAGRPSPAPSRDNAIAPLRVVDVAAQSAVTDQLAGVPPRAAEARRAWRVLTSSSAQAASAGVLAALARVVDAMPHPALRDDFVWSVVPELASGCLEKPIGVSSARLLALLPAVPSVARAHWLCLVALAQWREGDGVSARLSAGEAHEVNGSLPLVELVMRMTSSGMTYAEFTRPPRTSRRAG